VRLTNWAGNRTYAAERLFEPTSLDELQEIVRASRSLRVLGSRHSFNGIADTTGDLVSLAGMPRVFELDRAVGTVKVDGGVRYGELCGPLDAAGFALHNLASLPHISVAGACATATHGSGDRSGNLATAVQALEMVTADGETISLSREQDPDVFSGAVVGLGGLGVVTALTLELQPTFRMRQDLYQDLPLSAATEHFDEITALADSVSLFTAWRGPMIEQVWLKRRVPDGDRFEPPTHVLGATRATVPIHPVRHMPADALTRQLGAPGPWHERMPHFRMDHTPSAGAELQTEYLMPRRHAADVLRALDGIRERFAPVLLISEIRTIAADDLWMSTAFERASVAAHFTWQPDWDAVRAVLPVIEAALAPFEPRPHWGKLFTMPPEAIASVYPRLPAFVALLERHDPRGTFRNAFLRRNILGETPAVGGDVRVEADRARLRELSTAELTAVEVTAIRAMLEVAFGNDEEERFTEDDWLHALGGTHFVLDLDGRIVGHASVVERQIHIDGRPLRTGYVEAVAIAPDRQGTGFGSRLMDRVTAFIRDRFELGALGTGRHGFYERLGWLTWTGPGSVRTGDGTRRTPDEDGYLMVLATPSSPALDRAAAISCEWRTGDVW
jgi:alditol oxidase